MIRSVDEELAMTTLKATLSDAREHVSRARRRLTGGWKTLAETPVPAEEVDRQLRQASLPSWGFFFMLVLSSAIATFGLLSNSAPAIIGAMIIAPLMAPILGLAYGIVVFEWQQTSRATLTVVAGTLVVVAFAYLTTSFIGLRIAGSEILSRTMPTLLDLGVAMAAGAAGAFAYSRKSIANSIAGVAIAVALVPPLAVTGIGLAMGRKATADVGLSLTEIGLYGGGQDIARGAFILFLTNLAGIVVVAGAVLVSQRYGELRKALLGLVAVSLAAVFLMEPLGESLHKLSVKSRAMRLVATLTAVRPDLFNGRGRIDSLHVTYRKGLLHVDMDGYIPRDDLPQMQESVDVFRDYLSEKLGEPVVVEVEAVPLDAFHFISAPEGYQRQDPAE
jgi:uncharacterized hydrophobic protein (TIGR00271 family)